MNVYIYPAGALPGAMHLAVGTLGQQLANSFAVTIAGGAAALAAGQNYVLAVGAPLQNNDQRQNGYPTNGQLMNIAGNVYTFIV
ncbi:hypothetical protein ACWEQG_06085 [Microbispora sp. NPDC004025]|uniref:hypothetical protein n=1 Tax=Microbispora sp. NPDC049633 TaxID=3154355 RepID=UPI00341B1929